MVWMKEKLSTTTTKAMTSLQEMKRTIIKGTGTEWSGRHILRMKMEVPSPL